MAKKVFVSGCYDLLHSGHVEFFQQASRYGDLYVGIGSDATYLEYKHRKPMFPQEERLFMVKNIKAVKDAYINEGSGVIDFLPTLDKVKPDVFVVNAEGGSDEKRRICKERGIEYVELQRTPHAGLKARSSSDLKKALSNVSENSAQEAGIPTRLDLAGTWIDQPYVSHYHPGWAITISLEPTFEVRDRCGLSTSTRKMIQKIWPVKLPKMDPEMLARLVFCFENNPERHDGIISGAQDSIGICVPGLVRHYYDNNFWPEKIESTQDEMTLRFLEDHLVMIPGAQQPELTYTVDGLVDGDELTTKPTLKLVHEAEADPMKTAGEYVITFDQAPAADAAKYDLVTADGKLTVSVRPVYVGPTGSSVEVGRSDNGTVTVSPANAAKGTTVTITANPGKGQELKSLEVLDQHGNSLPLTDLGNGKFSFVMPAGKVTVKPVFGAADAYRNPYADVQTNDWYFGAVQYVTENGLMNGTGNGFEPNLATSRAMIWTILARMSDVNTASSGEWYAVAQQWAIANGVSDGTMPNGTITREQLAAMLYRYAVSKGMVKGPATADLSVFADANSVSSYAVEAMQWAVSAGLISGMDGKLNPQGSATRAQVATMLMRFAELAK